MEKVEFLAILRRYRSGTASKEEIAFIEAYYKAFEAEPDIVNMLTETERNTLLERSREELLSTLSSTKQLVKRGVYRRMPAWGKIAAAIVAFVLLAGTGYWLTQTLTKENQIVAQQIEEGGNKDISPGTNKASLTLADGSMILLDSVGTGNLANQGNTQIIKLDSGQLAYNTENSYEPIAIPQYNVITTPRGGQYSIVLPDGSKVWLNAASSLKFPIAFTGEERLVELTGEGYFEVAKNAAKPFRVRADQTIVEAIGTAFNINAYNDEPAQNTTLVEGKVKLTTPKNEVMLTPGQQAVVKQGNTTLVENVTNMEGIIGWKDAWFHFDDTDIKSIMRQVSRWYDVDIKYETNIQTTFTADIERSLPVSRLLRLLENTQTIKFRIGENTITVLPVQ
ncbi:MAG: FecR family protein [Agriterribacter sp.]